MNIGKRLNRIEEAIEDIRKAEAPDIFMRNIINSLERGYHKFAQDMIRKSQEVANRSKG